MNATIHADPLARGQKRVSRAALLAFGILIALAILAFLFGSLAASIEQINQREMAQRSPPEMQALYRPRAEAEIETEAEAAPTQPRQRARRHKRM